MHKPQTLTVRIATAVVAVFAVLYASNRLSQSSLAAADESADKTQGSQGDNEKSKTTAPPLKRSDQTADEVFAGIAEQLDSVSTLSCELRQSVMLSGQRFLAVGTYSQASGNRMRLDYRIFPTRAFRKSDGQALKLDGQPEDADKLKETGSLLQVSDGSVLWSYWQNGDHKTLARRNISEILAAAEEAADYTSARMLQDLGVGGLQTLMSQLQVGMDYGAVQEQQLGSTQLLVLTGRWTQQIRKDVFGAEDPKAQLPDFVPDYVRIYVDSASKLPRRIQYLKKHPDPDVKKIRPLITLDLRNINLQAQFSDDTFTFTRPEEEGIEEVDRTAQVVETLKRLANAGEQPDGADDAGTDTDSGDQTSNANNSEKTDQ